LLSPCALLKATDDGRKFIENGFAPGSVEYDSKGEEGESVNTDFIDCPEVAGKTIQLLRIHRDTGDGSRVQIELTDGTSFTCYVLVRPAVEASLYKGGAGAPETIRDYKL
jgi:hypothetical protein